MLIFHPYSFFCEKVDLILISSIFCILLMDTEMGLHAATAKSLYTLHISAEDGGRSVAESDCGAMAVCRQHAGPANVSLQQRTGPERDGLDKTGRSCAMLLAMPRAPRLARRSDMGRQAARSR